MNNAKSNNFPATFCGTATIETQGWDRCSLYPDLLTTIRESAMK